MTAWTHRPLWTALASVGVAGLAALAPSTEQLSGGGLGVVALAAGVAIAVGLPLADLERKTRLTDDSRLATASRALGEIWLTLAVAAAVAPLVHTLGWFGVLVAALAWSTIAVAGATLRVVAGAGALIAVLVAAAGLIVSGVQGVSWTLLQLPQQMAWVSIEGWLGLGAVMGVLLAGAGFGHWSGAGGARRRTPIAVLGLGVLVLVGTLVRRAAAYDAGMLDGVDAIGAILTLILAVTAVLAVGWREGGPRPLRAVVGLCATLLLAGPALDALPLWWTVVLPLGMAIDVGLRAVRARGQLLVRACVSIAVLVAIAWWGWPGLPSPLAAAAIATLPVVALWVAGTRALLLRPA